MQPTHWSIFIFVAGTRWLWLKENSLHGQCSRVFCLNVLLENMGNGL